MGVFGLIGPPGGFPRGFGLKVIILGGLKVSMPVSDRGVRSRVKRGLAHSFLSIFSDYLSLKGGPGEGGIGGTPYGGI